MTVSSSGGNGNSNFIKPQSQIRKLREAPTSEQMDQKLKDVSHLYEKQFLREMMKSMRSTISESGGLIQQNQAEKIFRGQLDEEYVEKWGDAGGIGLSDVIYKQLIERLGPQLGITPAQMPSRGMLPLNKPQTPVGFDKPRGPIQVDSKSIQANPLQYKMHSDPMKPGKTTVQYDIPQKEPGKPASEVSMPWGGSVLGIKKISFDEYFIDMNHDNGMKSQMVFKGQLSENLTSQLQKIQNQTGAELQAGEQLGVLSPEAKSLFWTVESGETGSMKKTETTGLE